MSFDGSAGYVGVPDNATLDIPGDLSVEAWARPAALNGTTGTVVHKGLSDAQDATWQYRLSLTSGNRWKALVFSGANSYSVTASNLVPSVTRWDHLLLVRSGTSLTFYVNGAAVGTVAAGGTLNTGTGMLALGRTGSSSQFYFNGAIDEVAVYNTALAPARVAAHYNAGTTPAPATATATVTAVPTTSPQRPRRRLAQPARLPLRPSRPGRPRPRPQPSRPARPTATVIPTGTPRLPPSRQHAYGHRHPDRHGDQYANRHAQRNGGRPRPRPPQPRPRLSRRVVRRLARRRPPPRGRPPVRRPPRARARPLRPRPLRLPRRPRRPRPVRPAPTSPSSWGISP